MQFRSVMNMTCRGWYILFCCQHFRLPGRKYTVIMDMWGCAPIFIWTCITLLLVRVNQPGLGFWLLREMERYVRILMDIFWT